MPAATIIWFVLSWAGMIGAVSWALWSGGSPERMAALAFIAADLISWAALPHDGSAFYHLERWSALVDLALLALLLWLAMYAARFWPVIAAACQVVPCLGHMLRMFDQGFSAAGYARMTAFSAWPCVALLAIGTLMHRRRWRRELFDPSWTRSLPPTARRILIRTHMP